jgi:hypothetical protein
VAENAAESAIALVPAGLSPELAKGIALWLSGYSTRAAAAEVGCVQQTLWRHCANLPESVKSRRANYADAAISIIAPVMQEAYAQLGERLTDDTEKRLSAMELNVVAGTAADKIIGLERIKQGSNATANGLDTLLGKLVESGGGTITVEPLRTIDVTPERE